MDQGVEHIFRETLLSSIALSEKVMTSLGMDENDVQHVTSTFRDRDVRLLQEQQAIHHSEEDLIQSAKDTATELETLLRDDLRR
jgi:hypothetical protein